MSLQTSNYKCQICMALMPAKHKSDHLTVHFKDKISPLLARDPPFTCPKCRFVAMDRSSLIRHFATRHGLVDAFLKVREGEGEVDGTFFLLEIIKKKTMAGYKNSLFFIFFINTDFSLKNKGILFLHKIVHSERILQKRKK